MCGSDINHFPLEFPLGGGGGGVGGGGGGGGGGKGRVINEKEAKRNSTTIK